MSEESPFRVCVISFSSDECPGQENIYGVVSTRPQAERLVSQLKKRDTFYLWRWQWAYNREDEIK